MKKLVKLFYYVMFMLISILSFGSNLKEGDFYTLTVLHTNDIHGNVEDLPEYSTLIKQARENIKNLVVLEGGDIFARGEFEIFGGIPEINMINEMGYDAWVLGNNDFRLPKDGKLPETDETINNLIAASKQPTLCGNVIYKKDNTLLKGVEPYIIKNINGVKVGIIGLTSMKPQDRGYEPDKKFLNAVSSLKAYLKDLDGKTDINIVLSHCGLAVDTELAKVEGISAIIGADDHYYMPNPIYWVWNNEKSVPIVQHGGEEKHVLGRLELIYQQKDGKLKLVDFRGDDYDTKLVKEDEAVRDIIENYREKLESLKLKKSA